MDIFDAIAAAKANSERNPKLYEDHDTEGVAVITKTSQLDTRKGDKLALFEVTIKSAAGGNAPAPGSTRAIMFGLETEEDLGRLKTFVLRVLGVNEKEVSPVDLRDTIKSIFTDQAFKGFQFGYKVRLHTKKDKSTTWVVDYTHRSGQTPESVAAERKALGG